MICKQCGLQADDFVTGLCLDCRYTNGLNELQENASRKTRKWAAQQIRDAADEIVSPLLIDESVGLLYGLADKIEKGPQ